MVNVHNNWKPKRWLATLLSLFVSCTGMLYIGKGKWYLFYCLVTLLLVAIAFLSLDFPLSSTINLISIAVLVINLICAIHTYKLCKPLAENSKRPWFSYWWGIIVIYMMLVIPITLFRTFFYEPFRIASMSMAPNYIKGNHIITSKFGYGNYGAYGVSLLHTTPSKTVQRGDVIVFSYPPNPKVDFVMRVIGLPNEKISYKNKLLLINGKPLLTKQLTAEYGNEELMQETDQNVSWNIINTPSIAPSDFEFTVPLNSYFVMGDNRDNSNDSRYWDEVPAENIKGIVVYIIAGK